MWRQLKARPLLAAALLPATAAALASTVRCCTYVHPYLVNDESHR